MSYTLKMAVDKQGLTVATGLDFPQARQAAQDLFDLLLRIRAPSPQTQVVDNQTGCPVYHLPPVNFVVDPNHPAGAYWDTATRDLLGDKP
jgi:hypothetical protein